MSRKENMKYYNTVCNTFTQSVHILRFTGVVLHKLAAITAKDVWYRVIDESVSYLKGE